MTGVVVSYLTLRPRAGRAAEPTAEITAAGELEAIGESLGELVVPVPAADSRPRA